MEKDTEKIFRKFQQFLKAEPLVPLLTRNLSFLLDKGKRVSSVEINDKMESYTDGKKVTVSGLSCFLSPEYGPREWAVVLRVNLAHEIQHDNSSDFEDVKKIQDFYGPYLKKNYNINETIGREIAHRMLNCMEDGRINEIIVQRFPGYLPMMRFVNFGIRSEIDLDAEGITEFAAFDSQILSYCKTGYNMPKAKKYIGTRLESEFLGIRDFLDTGVASKTAHGCYEACVKALTKCAEYVASLCRDESEIMDFLESLHLENYSQNGEDREEQEGEGKDSSSGYTIRKLNKSSKSSGEGEGEESGDEDGENGEDGEDGEDGEKKEAGGKKEEEDGKKSKTGKNHKLGSDSGKGSSDKNNSEDEDEKESKDGSHGDQNSEESASERAKKKGPKSIDEVIDSGFSEKRSPKLTEEEKRDMLATIEEELRHAREAEKAAEVNKGDSVRLSSKEQAEISKLYPEVNFREVFPLPKKEAVPASIKEQAVQLNRKLTKILVVSKIASSGHRKGSMNPGSLWKVGIEDGNVFQRKEPPRLSDCAVYELIDGSGSMSSPAFAARSGFKNASKIFAALTTAAIMEEALKGLASTKITVFNAGYSDVEHTVVKDFNQNPIGSRCYDVIQEISGDNGNKDGYSIRIAAMDLAKRHEKHKILMVLSDGLPSAYHGTQEAVADVHSAVKWARNHGIIVIPIMFGDENFQNDSVSSYKAMYESNIIACKPSEITKEIEKILMRVVR